MAILINHKDNSLQFNKVSAPATPPAGTVVLYFDTATGSLSFKDESGIATEVGLTADLIITSDLTSDTINSTKELFNLSANDVTGVLIESEILPGTGYSLANIPVLGVDPQIAVTYSAIATAAGFYMAADGNTAFFVDDTSGSTSTKVYSIPLSTPFDLSTAGAATFDSVLGSGATTSAHGITFDDTGLEMYISKDTSVGSVEKFTLAIAFDPSSATYASSVLLTAPSSTSNFATSYRPDGTKAFKGSITATSRYVDQYTLGTAPGDNYDLITATNLVSFDIGTELTHTSNYITIVFSNDGGTMFAAQYNGSTASVLAKYSLNTAFDVSTLHTPVVFNVAGNGTILRMWFTEPDGRNLYWLEDTGNIYQYDTDLGDGAVGLTQVALKYNGANTLNTAVDGIIVTGNLTFQGKDAIIVPPDYITTNYPTTVVEGGLIYDSTSKVLKLYDGSAWATIGDVGNITVDNFADVTDYTAGTTTVLTLSVDPGSENNINVFFDGIVQHHTEYSLTGVTLTFSSVIPLGTLDVEVTIGVTKVLEIPSTDSVSTTTIQDGAVTDIKLAETYVNADGTSTMTGDLSVGDGTSGDSVNIRANTGSALYWLKRSDNTAIGVVYGDPSTGNVHIRRYAANGATVETDLILSNDGNLHANGLVPTAVTHLTRKDYVDDNFMQRITSAGGEADVDAQQTAGVYAFASWTNSPGSAQGVLTVSRDKTGGVSSVTSQTFVGGDGRMHYRYGSGFTPLVWQSWKEVFTTASGTLTGNLIVGDGTTANSISVRSVSTSNAILELKRTDGTRNGTVFVDAGTDSLYIRKYDNAGGTVEAELILADDGNVSLTGGANVPTAAAHLTRKDYVDPVAIRARSAATLGNVLNDAALIDGLSRSYETHADSPDGAWANYLTVKDSTIRGFQLAMLDGTDNNLYYRNQNLDGAAWEPWNRGVSILGDTMTGSLTIETSFPRLRMNATSAGETTTIVLRGGTTTTRGALEYEDTGGGVSLLRYASGGGLETKLELSNNGNVSTSGALPTDVSHLTRKDYVDTLHANRNVIINGNFDIWQRGISFAAIPNVTYSADRFQYEKGGSMAHTVNRSTDVPTYAQSGTKSNYSLLLDVTTADASIVAGDYTFISYRVEGYDYARLQGEYATLSFWVKGAKTGIHCVSFRNKVGDRSYIKEYTIATANVWQKVEVTVPLTEIGGTWDYTNGSGLVISFTLAAGPTFQTIKDVWQTGNYLATANQVNECDNVANNFYIAQVQLERGSSATAFEYKPIADELLRCQRYYWQGPIIDALGVRYGLAGIAGSLAGSRTLAMRGLPAVATITTPSYENSSAVAPIIDQNGIALRVTVTANGNYRAHSGVYEADAEL